MTSGSDNEDRTFLAPEDRAALAKVFFAMPSFQGRGLGTNPEALWGLDFPGQPETGVCPDSYLGCGGGFTNVLNPNGNCSDNYGAEGPCMPVGPCDQTWFCTTNQCVDLACRNLGCKNLGCGDQGCIDLGCGEERCRGQSCSTNTCMIDVCKSEVCVADNCTADICHDNYECAVNSCRDSHSCFGEFNDCTIIFSTGDCFNHVWAPEDEPAEGQFGRSSSASRQFLAQLDTLKASWDLSGASRDEEDDDVLF